MSTKRKGFKTLSPIVTPNIDNKYPVVDSNDIAGGYMYFNTLSDACNISPLKRKIGMKVYIISEDKEYRLVSNNDTITAEDWKETSGIVNTSSGSSTSTSSIQQIVQSELKKYASSNPSKVASIENTFTVDSANLPHTEVVTVPSDGTVFVQVEKEVSESVTKTTVASRIQFNNSTSNDIIIPASSDTTPFVTCDNSGLRATNCVIS